MKTFPDFFPDQWRIVCDFDGTVTPYDITDAVLDAFAPEAWKQVEEEWVCGKITARQCMARQIALIDAPIDRLNALLDEVPLVRGFVEFVDTCKAENLELTLISDGMDYAIERILSRHGIQGVPVIANRFERISPSRYTLGFPYMRESCGSGVCKCAAASSDPADILLIGDGASDFCLAKEAAFVLARRGWSLEKQCVKKGYAYRPYDDFLDILDFFAELRSDISMTPVHAFSLITETE